MHDVSDQTRPDSAEEFIASVRSNDPARVRELLANDAELCRCIDAPWFEFGAPAIVFARKSLPIVDLLREFGADINSRSDWWAGSYGVLDEVDTPCAEQLVERGAAIDIHAAAAHGWIDEVERLLAEDAHRVNAAGPDGQRPIHLACSVEMVDRLITAGADPELRDLDHSATAAQYHVDNQSLCRHLLSHGAIPDIFMAARLGDHALAAELIAEDTDVIAHTVGHCPGTKPLHEQASLHIYFWKLRQAATPAEVARGFGHPEFASWLIQQAAPRTKLVDACWCGDEDRAMKLIAENAGLPALLQHEDHCRLCDAAWTNRPDSVRLMLRCEFDRHVVGAEHMTPLNRAAFHGLDRIISLLLNGDSNPPLEVKNQYGGTALAACLFGRRNSWRNDGDFCRAAEIFSHAGAYIDGAWLPCGDESIDNILRTELRRRESTGEDSTGTDT